MATKTEKLYMYERVTGMNAGQRYVSAYKEHEMDHCSADIVLLGEAHVEINYPEVDTRQAQIDALEQKVEKERAESQGRINYLLDRISKLKAISHEVAE